VTRRFLPNPAFRAAKASLAIPESVAQRLAGAPMTAEGQVLDVHVQVMLRSAGLIPLPTLVHNRHVTAPQRRRMNARASAIGMPRARGVLALDRHIPGPGGLLPIRIYRSVQAAGDPPVIVFFHGGGWVVGGLDTHDGNCRMLAGITGAVVVSVAYRLAPEHPYPAAVEDALAAYRWAVQNTRDLGAAPHVAVMGDSAGGNLAAVVSAAARDHGDPVPIAQGLVYPATDMRMAAATHYQFSHGLFLTRADVLWFRDQYCPDPALWTLPQVSPLLLDDLTGLPTTRIWTAGFDPLRDEGEAYAARLAAAGVPTIVRREPTMIHGFWGMGVLPDGLRRIARVCREMGDLVAEARSRTA
jgi:acetyl esterase